jgi:hypothetical protein
MALLKLPEDKKKKINRVHDKKKASEKDSWKDFEQETADLMNNIPTIKESRRARASGALWFEKGDVIDDILQIENKERSGSNLTGGDKSISIRKSWLDKCKEEAMSTGKTPCLPFRFKNDSKKYVVIELDDLAQLITTMKAYMIELDRRDKE